jgi:hypothetical protein
MYRSDLTLAPGAVLRADRPSRPAPNAGQQVNRA